MAIEFDPGSAKIRATLAAVYCTIALYSAGNPQKYFTLARRHAQEALRCDERNAEAHLVLAVVAAVFDWNHDVAEGMFNTALSLEPANAMIHRWKAVFLLLPLKRLDDALDRLFEARELEPVLDLVFTDLAGIHNARREHDEALMYCDIAIENNRSSFRGHWMRGLTLECLASKPEDFSRAASEFEMARRYAGSTRSAQLVRGSLTHAYALAEDAENVRREIDDMHRQRNDLYISPYDFAVAYAGMGDSAKIMSWLRKAVEERAVGLTFLAVDPRWNPYHSDPEFKAILGIRRLRVDG
jgi:tetratricopeptide (TPR) repeat protein